MENLKVYQKWEDMTVYLYGALRSYPKSERFTLAAETIRASMEVGTSIVRANTTHDKTEKRRLLGHADTELARLKILVRMGMKMEFLPMKKYELLSVMLSEIGRMFGGWMKSGA